jgi:hypothetical protein
LQIRRTVLAGGFDRHSDLQVVTGRWGEVVLFYLDRIDEMQRTAKLNGPSRNISATTCR